ncbi:MAG TPA: hypothetical protein VN131_01580 [Mobilitalea sp.]|nr:hypothetical protein [Mobilitalea sp.]
MICRICGSDNPSNSTTCKQCESNLTSQGKDLSYYDSSNKDEGFSRQDSNYIKPAVISEGEKYSPSETEILQTYQGNNEPEYFTYLEKEENNENAEKNVEGDDHSNIKPTQRNPKLKFIGAAAVLAAIALCMIAFFINPDSSDDYTFIHKDTIEVFNNNETNETYIFNTEGEVLHKIDASAQPFWYGEGYQQAFLIDRINNAFYYADTKGSIPIIENQISLNSLSLKGKMLYAAADKDGNGQLKLFDPSSRTNKIMEAEKGMDYDPPCISPDGKSYAFTRSANPNDDTDCESFIIINGGRVKSLGKGITISIISNDGKYQYYSKRGTTSNHTEFYVKSDGQDLYLGDYSNNFWPVLWNKDYTELIYQDKYGDNNIIINGKNNINMRDTSQIKHFITPGSVTGFEESFGGRLSDISTFKNKVFIGMDNIMRYIDNDYNIISLASMTDPIKVTMSRDGNQIVFKNVFNEIEKLTLADNHKETIAEGAADFAASPDLSEIYYLKESNTSNSSYSTSQDIFTISPEYDLYYRKGKGKPVLLASRVIDLQMNTNGDTLFFIKHNDSGLSSLYYSKHGVKTKEIKGFESPGGLDAWNYGIVLKDKINDKVNIYYNSKGKEFKLILKNISEAEANKNN